MPGGKLKDSEFGLRMTGKGIFAKQIRQIFDAGRRQAGITNEQVAISAAAFRRPGGTRMELGISASASQI